MQPICGASGRRSCLSTCGRCRTRGRSLTGYGIVDRSCPYPAIPWTAKMLSIGEATVRSHEVWYYQRKVDLVVADPVVREASLALSQRIHEATFRRETIDVGLWHYLNPTQQAFLDAAREELGRARREQ